MTYYRPGGSVVHAQVGTRSFHMRTWWHSTVFEIVDGEMALSADMIGQVIMAAGLPAGTRIVQLTSDRHGSLSMASTLRDPGT